MGSFTCQHNNTQKDLKSESKTHHYKELREFKGAETAGNFGLGPATMTSQVSFTLNLNEGAWSGLEILELPSSPERSIPLLYRSAG